MHETLNFVIDLLDYFLKKIKTMMVVVVVVMLWKSTTLSNI